MKSRVVTGRARVIALVLRHAWIGAALSCTLLGYLLIWHRGSYWDDYSNTHSTFDDHTMQPLPYWQWFWHYHLFPTRFIGLTALTVYAQLLPHHELIVRLTMTAVIAANATLLGWLMHRLTGSRLAAVVSGAVLLMPFVAFEILWASVIYHLLGMTFALLSAHCSLSLVQRERWRWCALGLACYLCLLLSSEQFFSVVAVLPLCGGALALRERLPITRRRLAQTALSSAASVAILGGFFAVLRHGGGIFVRDASGFTLAPAAIIRQAHVVWMQFSVLTYRHLYGRHLTEEMWATGRAALTASWQAVALTALTVISLACAVIRWHPARPGTGTRWWQEVTLVGAGILWFVLTVFLPFVFSAGVGFGPRHLYGPSAGVAIVLGTVAAALTRIPRSHVASEYLLVALTGGVLFASTICTVGYATVFQERGTLDRQQWAAFEQTVPIAALPQDTVYVPYAFDQRLPDTDVITNGFFVGLFESSGAIGEQLVRYSRQSGVTPMPYPIAIGSRDALGTRFAIVPDDPHKIEINHQQLLADRVLLLTYQDHQMSAIASVTITERNGERRRFSFPLAAMLRARGKSVIAGVTVRDGLYEPQGRKLD